MNAKAQAICDRHSDHQCRTLCPLTEACKMQPGDTREIFDARMNAAAEKFEEKP